MRLQRQCPTAPAMADGGVALENLSTNLAPAEWETLTREFFLT
jgi:hypothetical protein